MAAIRRPVRSRSIRVLLIGMFAVPLVSLLVMWLIASLLTVPKALDAQTYKNNSAQSNSPAIATISFEVPTERADTYLWLLSGRKASKAGLLKDRAAIDAAMPAAIASFRANDNHLSASSSAQENQLIGQLQRLPSIRKAADSGTLTASAAFADFNTVIDAQYTAYDSSINQRGSVLVAESLGSVDAAYVLEEASRETAIADGAFLFEKGRMTPAEHQLFVASAADRTQLLAQALATLPPQEQTNYLAVTQLPNTKQFVALEAQIAGAADNKPLPVDGATWQKVSASYLAELQKTEIANGPILQALSASASNSLLTQAILAAGVGLVAVVASILLLLWFGRRVTRDLTKLDGNVRSMSEERLPRVVERLRRGDDVDVAAESPAVAGSTIQEINQIGRSFGIVQQAAVAAAVDQAQLRKGVNQVFLNISMRNQSLLHRQLSMLDSMERRTSDAGALADLFRLDHLTTRMRRHAEGLIILSGATPGRTWRDPVPVVDVLRAAVAEVEDYVRVDVTSESRDMVSGNAVNDIIHLVAELVENATVFSPPNTRIEVRADRAGTGLVAEIEDRGLGLSAEELADINRRLASPPEFDLANSEQLGLFVVSRLAIRHSIRVSLRQSVYGGTTAILVLPFGVIVREGEERPPAGGRPANSNGNGNGAPPAPGDFPPGGPEGDPAGAASEFGITGRHRLPSAATGRRSDTGPDDSDEVQGLPAPPRGTPRPQWDVTAPEPGRQAAGPGRPSGPPPAPPAPAPAPPGGRPPWETETVTPWSNAFSRSAAMPAPSAPGPSTQDHRPGANMLPAPSAGMRAPMASPPVPASGGSHLGMPVRVPQTNMAPQLRSAGGGSGQQQPAAASPPPVDDRTPEATRSMMIMMQQGWERGRADDIDDSAGGPDHGTQR
jgi:signal transduction histidine kinase